MLYKINNTYDMFNFIEDKEDDFKCVEDWWDWFGFELNSNDETGEILETFSEYVARGGQFNNIPHEDEYPVVVVYIQDTDQFTRFGATAVEVYDWISVK